MDEIYLNLSLDYCADWGQREAVREIVANARDVNPDDFDMRITGGNLIVSNGVANKINGEYVTLMPHHWVIGTSQKHTESPIGRFGEGLKVASAVLLRLGYTDIHIRSGWYSYYPFSKESEYPDDNSKLVYVEVIKEDSFVRQTQVKVKHWEEEMDFAEMFIFPNDDRLLYSSPTRDILYCAPDEKPKLFISGIFVTYLDETGLGDFKFSYNLNGEELPVDRDRNHVSGSQLRWEIGRVWGEVTDILLLERLWESVKSGFAEIQMDWDYARYRIKEDSKKDWYDALCNVHGGEVFLKTVSAISQHIQEETDFVPMGFEVKNEGMLFKTLKYIGVREDVEIPLEEDEPIFIPDAGQLDRVQATNLRMARTRIKNVAKYLSTENSRVYEPFSLEPAALGVGDDGESNTDVCLPEHNTSMINPIVLSDRVATFETIIKHMMEHWYGMGEDNFYSRSYKESLYHLSAVMISRLI